MLIASGRQFSWAHGSGNAELSDLGWSGAPVSFLVASHRTDATLTFRFKERLHDNEGEIVGWVYQSCEFLPTTKPVIITIFND